jgi:stage II sporulation protein AA (anti-sigma F factor antagonist)
MTVRIERLDGVPVARQHEDIDAANADRVREELCGLLGESVDNLVLDLGETRYLDSAGIDMLFRLNEMLRQRRASLLLVIPPDSQLVRLAHIVGLGAAMAVHETVEQALAACARGAPGGGPAPAGAERSNPAPGGGRAR